MSEQQNPRPQVSPVWQERGAEMIAQAQPTLRLPSLSVFFPDYNDGGTIASMVISAIKVCERVTDDYEVLVVNDASSDYSREVLDDLEARYPRFRAIHHETNRGYGGALRTGFREASKEWVFYTDGDAQYDPHELVRLIPGARPNIGMVNGYKIGRSDPIIRLIIGKVYHWGVKFAFGLRLRDTDCDFRLIRKSALDAIELTADTGTITVELQKKLQDAGYKFAEVPVHHYHRAYGQSQFFNFKRIRATLLNLATLWWKLRVRGGSRKAQRAAKTRQQETR